MASHPRLLLLSCLNQFAHGDYPIALFFQGTKQKIGSLSRLKAIWCSVMQHDDLTRLQVSGDMTGDLSSSYSVAPVFTVLLIGPVGDGQVMLSAYVDHVV